MKIPPWPLLATPPAESERLQRLRGDVKGAPGSPGSIWRELCLVWLSRLERAQDPKLRRLADIGFEEAWKLTYTVTADQESFYGELLDHARRLDLPRARPGAFDVWDAFLRCQQVRRALELTPAKGLPATQVQAIFAQLWQTIAGSGDLPPDLAVVLSKSRSAKEGALQFVAAALSTRGQQSISPRSLRSLFAKWKLDPATDDLVEIPTRDPSYRPATYDFEPLPRPRPE